MSKSPSRFRQKKNVEKPSIVSILDTTFIIQFFLILSASFARLYEVPTVAPLISDQEVKEDKKPLALTIKVEENALAIYTGIPSTLLKRFVNTAPETYNLEELHNKLIEIKKNNQKENSAILEPVFDLSYEKLVQIIDSVRVLKNTDPAFFIKDKSGVDVKAENLFADVVFGNIQS